MEKRIYDNVEYMIDSDNQCNTGILNCDCIDIKDDRDTFVFKYFGKPTRYSLTGLQKSFKNIRTIVIEQDVRMIYMKNETFPNVQKVISYSKSFLNNSDMLIDNYGKALLNSFCKPEDYTLDMDSVEKIAPGALDGCMSTNIVNTDLIMCVAEESFKGYKYNPDKETGAYMFGDIMFGTSLKNGVCDIPAKTKMIIPNLLDKKETIKLHSLRNIFSCNAKKVILELGNDYSAMSPLRIAFKINSILPRHFRNLEKIEVHSNHFETVDGILYSKDMSNLIFCPKNKTGEIVIPEGVKCIEPYAFQSCKISSVSLPSSVEVISTGAFQYCEELESIKMSYGLKYIADSAFSRCISLTSVCLPVSIEEIGSEAFNACPIHNLAIPEGIHVIHAGTFSHASGEIFLPSTVKYVLVNNFKDAKIIHAEDDIPNGLIYGLVRDSNIGLIEVTTQKGSLLVPHLDEQGRNLITLLKTINCFDFNDVQEEFVSLIWRSCTLMTAFNMSLEIYNKKKCKNSKMFCNAKLREYNRQIENDNFLKHSNNNFHDAMIKVVESDILDTDNLRFVLKEAQQRNDTTLIAYVLEQLNNSTSDVNLDI